jgi:hypothetical protein
VALPAANGTMKVTGLDGKACASAAAGSMAAVSAAAARRVSRRRGRKGVFMSVSPG